MCVDCWQEMNVTVFMSLYSHPVHSPFAIIITAFSISFGLFVSFFYYYYHLCWDLKWNCCCTVRTYNFFIYRCFNFLNFIFNNLCSSTQVGNLKLYISWIGGSSIFFFFTILTFFLCVSRQENSLNDSFRTPTFDKCDAAIEAYFV
jgi:hypothetical protein